MLEPRLAEFIMLPRIRNSWADAYRLTNTDEVGSLSAGFCSLPQLCYCIVLVALLGGLAFDGVALAQGGPGGDSAEVIRWAARSAALPFDDELRLLAADAVNPAYQQLLEKMIRTDLDAEWQRVATVDNYQTFLTKHGGKEKVQPDPELKAAFDVRREIAMQFVGLVRGAYEKQNREPSFNEQKVDELCANANRPGSKVTDDLAVPIRVLMVASGAEGEWPQFRGPTGQGIVIDERFPLHWSADKNVIWKKGLPGPGNSSPMIWGQKLFVTSASADGMQRWLLCYSTQTGELLWQHAAPIPVEKLEKLYNKNSYASSSPATDGERVVAFFGNSGILCCDLEGKELWVTNLGPFPTMHGPGTSPVLYGDKVIFIQDQNSGESVFVALNKHDGHVVWRQQRPAAMCWSTPIVVHTGQRDELLYNGSNFFAGYDPNTGTELWRITGASRESSPMPVIGGGKIYSVSGRNGPMLAFKPGGNGDLTLTNTLWSVPRGGPHVPTPVYVNNRLFMVNDMGIASCRNATTGELVWQERLSGRFSMSMLTTGDKLIATSESGSTHLLKASDRFEEIAVNELNETVLATPAIVRGHIYFRTAENLICIGETTQ